MCIECKILPSGGDMSPRMWICNDTGKPTTGFVGTEIAINEGVELLGITEEESIELAWNFLNLKRQEYKEKGGTYFCEDSFDNDLREYWKTIGSDLSDDRQPIFPEDAVEHYLLEGDRETIWIYIIIVGAIVLLSAFYIRRVLEYYGI